MRFAPVAIAVLSLLSSPSKAAAAVDLTEEDFYLYCGYLDTLEQPDVAKLKGAAREKKIAGLAKVPLKKLQQSVEKGTKVGATCAEIGKKVQADARRALEEALPGRVDFFDLDFTDAKHVVGTVRWVAAEKKNLNAEASLVAFVLAHEAPIVKTIALRAVDATAKDRTTEDARLFDAKISSTNAARIDRDHIGDYAETRYVRLFDGVVRK
jgi:hypothetical protein